MIATEIPVSLTLPPSKAPRSDGVHVSAIIGHIAAATGVLRPEWIEDLSELSIQKSREITDPTAILRICIGLAWEEWLIPRLEGVIDHPGEIKLGGVYMTPDGESLDVMITVGGRRNQTVIHEVKATYKSTNTVGDLSGQWMWMSQCKSYCKAHKTRFCKMHVLFLCGDYSYPIKPMLKCWAVEFTQKELDDNWTLLMEYKDHRLEVEGR